jgi:lauroyl/myristoyl acyltransferase
VVKQEEWEAKNARAGRNEPKRSLLRFLYAMVDLGTRPYILLSGKKRTVLREETRSLFHGRFDQRKIDEIVFDSMRLYLKRQAENALFGRLTKDNLETMTTVEGLSHIDRAIGRGRGVILLLAHFGSFLLPLPVLGFRGYNVNQITGKVLSRNAVTDIIWQWRKREADRLPIKFIGVANFLRPVYDALKKGEIVAIAFDGREGKRWIPVRFVERIALFSPGPMNLALKTGAAIIPTFVVRQPNDSHRIIFMDEFEMTRSKDEAETLEINTKRYAALLEDFVIRYPSHFGATLIDARLNAERGLTTPLFKD